MKQTLCHIDLFPYSILISNLATRLNNYIGTIIHPDQTGFIPNIFSFFNVRKVMDLIYHRNNKATKQAIIYLDTEKAIDQVEWEYLFKVPERFHLDEDFISWIRLIYNMPTASSMQISNPQISTIPTIKNTLVLR